MGINQITPMSDINDYLQEQIEKREQVIINTLNYIGTECVNRAKQSNRYIDQTGNLRSSIGYVVVKNGTIINGGEFEQIKNGEKGKSQGESFIHEIANSTKGICLIVVAGMNYASYVEATGRDVLTSAELLAEIKIPEMLKQLGFTVK